MDTSLILLILGFIVVVILILKFVKSIISAIFGIVFTFILIIAAIFGLVYLDYNNLVSQNNIYVNLAYQQNDKLSFGIDIPIINKSVDENGIKELNQKQLNIDINNYDSENTFYIITNEKYLNDALENNKKYYLIGTENLSFTGLNIKTELTKEQVINLLNSNSAVDDYTNIILSENNVPSALSGLAKTGIKSKIESTLKEKKISFRSALLASSLYDEYKYNSKRLITITLEDYKNETLKIIPDRTTLWLVRQIPINLIVDNLPKEILEN